jgi:hypothetical protein
MLMMAMVPVVRSGSSEGIRLVIENSDDHAEIFRGWTVFLMHLRGRLPVALKLHSAGRWAYPLTYFGVLLVLCICFL